MVQHVSGQQFYSSTVADIQCETLGTTCVNKPLFKYNQYTVHFPRFLTMQNAQNIQLLPIVLVKILSKKARLFYAGDAPISKGGLGTNTESSHTGPMPKIGVNHFSRKATVQVTPKREHRSSCRSLRWQLQNLVQQYARALNIITSILDTRCSATICEPDDCFWMAPALDVLLIRRRFCSRFDCLSARVENRL